MGFRLVRELAESAFPVTVACRVPNLSTSGYYDWLHRLATTRDLDDAHLIGKLRAIHDQSGAPHGVRRCHAELRLAAKLDWIKAWYNRTDATAQAAA